MAAVPSPDEIHCNRDLWGRPIADDESADEEVARLLMPMNWICDLLERMIRTPSEADRYRSICDGFIRRMSAGCRSPELRDILIDATVRIAGRRYDIALAALRAAAH